MTESNFVGYFSQPDLRCGRLLNEAKHVILFDTSRCVNVAVLLGRLWVHFLVRKWPTENEAVQCIVPVILMTLILGDGFCNF